MVTNRRKMDRRDADYYLSVTDPVTLRPRGIMTNISLGGFKLERHEQIPNGEVDHFRLDLTKDIAPQPFLVFTGRSKWCQPDTIDSSIYNVGYEIVNMSAQDAFIYQSVFEKCGVQTDGNRGNNADYLWR